ncbi:hypothetical protein CDAR_223381 [Caerostris darwini]|uniref:Uncharacterized protein n=1 Tax=Caerostris darwini TaxID=1538125 RepID=A0AAV4W727_9ARAC|nr:hypothetical protein CDAR_223381 [Caerostris darwini]
MVLGPSPNGTVTAVLSPDLYLHRFGVIFKRGCLIEQCMKILRKGRQEGCRLSGSSLNHQGYYKRASLHDRGFEMGVTCPRRIWNCDAREGKNSRPTGNHAPPSKSRFPSPPPHPRYLSTKPLKPRLSADMALSTD